MPKVWLKSATPDEREFSVLTEEVSAVALFAGGTVAIKMSDGRYPTEHLVTLESAKAGLIQLATTSSPKENPPRQGGFL